VTTTAVKGVDLVSFREVIGHFTRGVTAISTLHE
jgi:hypothetical protein